MRLHAGIVQDLRHTVGEAVVQPRPALRGDAGRAAAYHHIQPQGTLLRVTDVTDVLCI